MTNLGRLNTLRNQIFLGFMLVMIIVLSSVGAFMYDQVSVLLRHSEEKHIQQTAIQASGKLEAMLGQIDSLTAQVATNGSVQRLLLRLKEEVPIGFGERQVLQQEVRKYEAYVTGIHALELYTTDYQSLLLIDGVKLDNRVSIEWIKRADKGRGQLIWFGLDPRNPDMVIAIRSVRLIDRAFTHAGYIVVHMDKGYFQLTSSIGDYSSNSRELMGLFDEAGRYISSDFSTEIDASVTLNHSGETIDIGAERFITVQKQLGATGWTLVILTPIDYATEGISILRTAILVSGAVGALLFLIITFILSTMITRPILDLIKVMRGARLGKLKQSMITSSTMEINELQHTYNQMVYSLNELIEVVYQKEIIQSRTELKALQAQINPHFLFNTLEAFYWSLEEKGEEDLGKSVVAMSGLFRYVINRTDMDEWVTIDDEIEHVERYLIIMKMRMLDRLSWRIELDPVCRNVPLPKLMIQPLVENAIVHGVEQRVGPGTVILQVKPSSRRGYTAIKVIDDGPGMSADKVHSLYEAMNAGWNSSSKGSGIGIANVERRLQLSYESEAGRLDIRSEEGKGTCISFEVPNEYGEGCEE